MTKHRRKGGRTTPKGTRPAHLRPVSDQEPDGLPLDRVIDSGARDVLGENHPVSAEAWASGLLEVFESARWQARLARQEVPPFEEAVLARCLQRRDRHALIVAAGLAAVAPPPLDEHARRVVHELRSTKAPSWLDAIGRSAPTRAWTASDVFGDQDSLIIGFTQPGETRQHAIVVLIDNNLSGQAKDAFIAGDVDEVVSTWESNPDPHIRIREVTVDDALTRLGGAMAASDLWNGDTELRTEDFARHRALIWARLRRSGRAGEDAGVGVGEIPREQRKAIVAEFLSSPVGREVCGSLAGTDVELITHYLVDLRSDYEGRPLRWSPNVVAMLLGDLAPRKLLLDRDQAAVLPAVLRAFVRFSAERTGLASAFLEEVLAAVAEAEPEFNERIGDPDAAGPAKAMLAALQASGVDLSDLEAVNDALEDAAPVKLPQPAPKRLRKAAVAPTQVVAAAEGAPILFRFAALVDFYGDGRKLTQTGQPTLADARALVDLLGTDDSFDEKIGDRTFKTKSASELPELGFTIRWAVAAGALRKEHGKLRATAAWRRLEGKALERCLKAADTLTSLGPLAAFYAHARYRHPDELIDDLVPEILHALTAGAVAFDTVLDWTCDRAEAMYEWLTPYMQDADHRRSSFRWDLDQLARILGWAGIADRTATTVEPDRWASHREHLVGGTLQLTPVGRWWLGASQEP